LGECVFHIQLPTTIQPVYPDDSECMEPDHMQRLFRLMIVRKME
jgi:hypothetical protein